MKIFSFELTKNAQALMETEILYSIASARASGADFLALKIVSDEAEKIKSVAAKVLRAAKKQEKIQLFISSRDLSTTITEAQYLNNKYPTLTDYCVEGTEILFVKV